MSYQVTVVGNCTIDYLYQVPHLPQPGETLHATSFEKSPGGKGANQAVAAARLGAQVAFVGRVGDDEDGHLIATTLAAAGVDLSHLIPDPAGTGLSLIFVDPHGENHIVTLPRCYLNGSPEDIDAAREVIASAQVLLLQQAIPEALNLRAAEIARAAGRQVILNPTPRIALTPELLPLVDVLTPNAFEVTSLTGQPDPKAAAQQLLAKGVGAVVVTLGKRGALVVTDTTSQQVPAPQVTPVDTTGAGDVFNGALAVALANGTAPVPAVEFACSAAALSTTRQGAMPSAPTLAEVMAFRRRV